jgi:plastocyanin
MVKIIVRVTVIVGAVGIVLTGCGSDTKTTTTASSSPAGSASSAAGANPVSLPGTVNEPKVGDATSGSIDVELDDFYFGPSFIKAKPGQTLTLKLKNDGTKAHTFTSAALKVDETLQPGQSVEKPVTLPSSGATEFHCSFHQGQGMQGAFFFKAGDTVGAGGDSGGDSTTTASSGYYN